MDGQQEVSHEVKVTEQMMDYLRSTKTWTRIMSIIFFIISGIMMLAGVLVFLTGTSSAAQNAKMPPTGMGIVNIVLSIFYVIASIYLFKYSSALGRFLNSKKEFELVSALSYEKSFWKIVGISFLLSIVAGIVAAIVVPLMVKH